MRKSPRHLHRTLKKYFIPHRGNRYRPHLLHPKHTLWYTALFLALKVFLIVVALFIPAEAFVTPNVLAEQQTKLIALTNQVRVQKGLSPLEVDPRLMRSATVRAEDMLAKQYFSHASPDGHRLSYFLNRAGYPYRTAGENLAMGFSDADGAMNGWLKSPTHYANLVDPDFEEMGIAVEGGVYHDQPTVFVAQHFGTPYASESTSPVPVPEPKNPHPEPAPTTNPLEGRVARAPIPTQATVVLVASPVASTTHSVPESPLRPTSTAEVPTRPGAVRSAALATTTIRILPRRDLAIAPTTPSIALIATTTTVTTTMAIVEGSAPPVSGSIYRYDSERSAVSWREQGDKTLVQVQAYIEGEILLAQVDVEGYPIELRQTFPGVYTGELTLFQSPQELFKVIVSPTLNIMDAERAMHTELIDWHDPLIVSQTPWQRYLQANSWLYTSIPVFAIVHWFYVLALILFTGTLTLAVCLELRKQHPHLVLRAVALIFLLVWCVKF